MSGSHGRGVVDMKAGEGSTSVSSVAMGTVVVPGRQTSGSDADEDVSSDEAVAVVGGDGGSPGQGVSASQQSVIPCTQDDSSLSASTSLSGHRFEAVVAAVVGLGAALDSSVSVASGVGASVSVSTSTTTSTSSSVSTTSSASTTSPGSASDGPSSTSEVTDSQSDESESQAHISRRVKRKAATVADVKETAKRSRVVDSEAETQLDPSSQVGAEEVSGKAKRKDRELKGQRSTKRSRLGRCLARWGKVVKLMWSDRRTSVGSGHEFR
jgi:hypothetical protein